MAKKSKDKRSVITIVAKDESGKITYSYHTEKNKMNTKDKLVVKKYNPVTKKHEKFTEKK